MTSTTLSNRLHAEHGPALVLQQALQAGNLLLNTLLSSRGYVSKLQRAERLLRQSNRVETSQPERAEALRQAAADQMN